MNLFNRNLGPAEKDAFLAGYDAMQANIKGMGFIASRDKFNLENPYNVKYGTMLAYAYASGEFEALKDNLCTGLVELLTRT